VAVECSGEHGGVDGRKNCPFAQQVRQCV
jgi:hypothetical protein